MFIYGALFLQCIYVHVVIQHTTIRLNKLLLLDIIQDICNPSDNATYDILISKQIVKYVNIYDTFNNTKNKIQYCSVDVYVLSFIILRS